MKQPRGKEVYINEDLSPGNTKIFQETWQRQVRNVTNGLNKVWINCQVKVKKCDIYCIYFLFYFNTH